MMGLYVQLDVDYQTDPKIIAAGIFGECLFNRALALCKRTLIDGKVNRLQLPSLCIGIPGRPNTHANRLVEAGLWAEDKDGWLIVSWAKRNALSDDVKDKTARKKASAKKANHERWHVGEDAKPSISCELCYPTRIRRGSESESPKEELEVEPELEEEEEPITSDVRRGSDRAEGFDEFWAEFPKKVAKPDALKAWKAIKAPRPTLDQLHVAIAPLKARPKPEIQYIFNPARWLRNRCWEDDPIPVTQPTRTKTQARADVVGFLDARMNGQAPADTPAARMAARMFPEQYPERSNVIEIASGQ